MKFPIWLLLTAASFAQVAPSGLNIAVDYRTAPELSVIFSWLPVAGATSYNVYKTKAAVFTTCAASPMVLDENVTDYVYTDNPNPGWWKLPTSNTDGRWKNRQWCYWVSSVVNGVESAKAGPAVINIGNAGYVFLGFRGPGTYSMVDKCAGGPHLLPPSSNLSDYDIDIYYAGADGVHHSFQLQTLFDGPTVVAGIWHAPSIATDGFVIPWNDTGRYGYRFTYKPWNKSAVGLWGPRGTRMNDYYVQVETDMLIDPGNPDNGAQCADNYFGTEAQWENIVTR